MITRTEVFSALKATLESNATLKSLGANIGVVGHKPNPAELERAAGGKYPAVLIAYGGARGERLGPSGSEGMAIELGVFCCAKDLHGGASPQEQALALLDAVYTALNGSSLGLTGKRISPLEYVDDWPEEIKDGSAIFGIAFETEAD